MAKAKLSPSGVALEITKALAIAEDAEQCDQKEGPSEDADPMAHPSVRDRTQEADLVKINFGILRFRDGDRAFPPMTSEAAS
jgi:hypothetical protein